MLNSTDTGWTVKLDFDKDVQLLEYKYVIEPSNNEGAIWKLDGFENRIAVI